ncbi:type VI secretion system-associated FHA domain protein TagH [Burkholderia guangdongensis]|uniref:type VI secretion system-associated FHA domain protein TagH n=1 Tax=Burkholderia guangdongensis TaxID=1792500 RepID=UPI001C5405DE|nr:type VI secretion system-associated FHA domain protein TagH [Burkholderia guangdongensis]
MQLTNPVLSLRVARFNDEPVAEPMAVEFGPAGGTIGRATDCTLMLPDQQRAISRVQARIECRGGEYLLCDLGANPSVLNERAIGGTREARLANGDRLVIGPYLLEVAVHEREAGAQPGFHDPLAAAKVLSGPLPDSAELGPLGPLGLVALDPLGQPGFGAQAGARPGFGGSQSDHVAPEFEAFSSPVPAAVQPALGGAHAGGGIPADYDPLADALAQWDAHAEQVMRQGQGAMPVTPAMPAMPAMPVAPAMPAFAPGQPVQPPPAPQGGPTGLPASLLDAPAPGGATPFDDLFGAAPPSSPATAQSLPLPLPDEPMLPVQPPSLPPLPTLEPLAHDLTQFVPPVRAQSPSEPPSQPQVQMQSPPQQPAASQPLPIQPLPLVEPPLASQPMPSAEPPLVPQSTPLAEAPLVPQPTPLAEPPLVPQPMPPFVPQPGLRPEPQSQSTAPTPPIAATPAAVRQPTATQATQATPAPLPHSADPTLAALIAGLGLDPTRAPNLPPAEFAHLIGAMLREALRGTMTVLRSRSTTKREARLDTTVIVARDNNPLKFFPDVDSALAQMLAGRSAGYLPPDRALEYAFADIQSHELAVIAGMRAALAHVLGRFDPAALEAELTEQGVMDKLLSNRKAKLWDRFVQMQAQIARDSEDDFQRLFGNAFNDAYEAQIDALLAARKTDSGEKG